VQDILFLLVTAGFFALAWALVRFTDRLGRDGKGGGKS
jgi:hypothetical protein